jgi:hypothetical protein
VPKNPYEWLYEREAQPLKSYVLDEVAKLLAAAVEAFPPTIEDWEREDLRQRFEPLLRRVQGRPDVRVVRCALQLFRWEIERDVERIDGYMRGEHWREHGLGPDELETAIFLWQFWLDQTLAFKEYAQEKFTRKELLGLADRLDTRLVEAPPPSVERH